MTEHYCVQTSWDVKLLEAGVNALMEEGFDPIGGVVTVMAPNGDALFAQALVRRKKKKKEAE